MGDEDAMADSGGRLDRRAAPDLWTLFGAYLHQDWDHEYGDDVWDAVRDFRSGTAEHRVAGAADQARRLLDADLDEDGLKAVLDEMGLAYRPAGDGWSYRGWLTELERFLRSTA